MSADVILAVAKADAFEAVLHRNFQICSGRMQEETVRRMMLRKVAFAC